MNDRLRVLATTSPVVSSGAYVQIAKARLQEVAGQLVGDPFRPAPWNADYHYAGGEQDTANYILLLDALNFSFWGSPKWRVAYRGECLDGYWALAAALRRGIEEGVPLCDAAFLATLEERALHDVLRGEGAIPLLAARLANAREVGAVLRCDYGGQFANLIGECGGSALVLAERLAEGFPSFRDVVSYRGREVRFLKRAQICAADLYGAFGGRGLGRFADLDGLTAFADYKLPQVLRALGILVYAPDLAARIDNLLEIPPGSPPEIAIRANTIWAVEKLRQELEKRGLAARAFEIDWWLWQLGQDDSAGLPLKPYHRTRTIYY